MYLARAERSLRLSLELEGYFTYYDSHLHSLHSKDAVPTVFSICEEAVSRGLLGIAITDHADVDSGEEDCLGVMNGLASDVLRAREAFGGRLEISLGVELGEAHHNVSLARELVSDERLDFVIGSLHHPRMSEDYFNVDYDHADMDAMWRKYYGELAEMVEAGCFDVVGHINYQVRYMSESARARVDLSRYLGMLESVLDAVIRLGKGIEINASGLWRGLGITLPSAEVIETYRKRGGKIITTGSDAHAAVNVGGAIEEAAKRAAAAGFEKFAFYRKRAPYFYDAPR
jgi:histidinol-phosphatase (PHP family)